MHIFQDLSQKLRRKGSFDVWYFDDIFIYFSHFSHSKIKYLFRTSMYLR